MKRNHTIYNILNSRKTNIICERLHGHSIILTFPQFHIPVIPVEIIKSPFHKIAYCCWRCVVSLVILCRSCPLVCLHTQRQIWCLRYALQLLIYKRVYRKAWNRTYVFSLFGALLRRPRDWKKYERFEKRCGFNYRFAVTRVVLAIRKRKTQSIFLLRFRGCPKGG